MSHTPGPWFVAEKVESKTRTSLRRIRSVNEGTDHGAVCEVYGISDGSEAGANARLIAAAPALLDACQRVLRSIEWWGTADRMDRDEQIAILRDAIEKATGE